MNLQQKPVFNCLARLTVLIEIDYNVSNIFEYLFSCIRFSTGDTDWEIYNIIRF